jgi:Leucine-rich repeat (LRR) protein
LILLEELKLCGFNLDVVDLRILENLSSLSRLKLCDNYIFSFKNPTKTLLSLTAVELESNFIKNTDFDLFKYINSLEKLYINNNYIKCLPTGVFDSNTDLIYLNLSNNELNSIDFLIGSNLFNLREIRLNNNDITSISLNLFEKMTNLNYLTLSNYKLYDLNQTTFQGLSNLSELDLSHNNLTLLKNGYFQGKH